MAAVWSSLSIDSLYVPRLAAPGIAKSISRQAGRVSAVDGVPSGPNLLPMVDSDRSAARMPVPAAPPAVAGSSLPPVVTSHSPLPRSRQGGKPRPNRSRRDRRVPHLHRRRVPIVTEDVQRRGVEEKMLTGGYRQTDPSRDQDPEDVAMREQGDVARRGADPGDDAVRPCPDLVPRPAARRAAPEAQPARPRPGDRLPR